MRKDLIMFLMLILCSSVRAQGPPSVAIPTNQTIARAVLWRTSDKKDASGIFLPPWKKAAVTNVFGFKKKPGVGTKATIVPLGAAIAPFDLRITKLTERKDCDDSKAGSWWEVEFEAVTNQKVLGIDAPVDRSREVPFDVAVIYPAVSLARQIESAHLTKEMLPRGVLLSTVKAALDLNNDGKPDALITEYCCDDAKKSVSECDYTCGKSFKKIGGVWRIIDKSGPC